MFRNYLAAAIGNIGRNGFYAGITILGLAVSFAAAILIGLFLRDEYTFERFIPGHERVYRLENDIVLPGQKPQRLDRTPVTAAGFFRLDFPEAEKVARIEDYMASFQRGEARTSEAMFWADPDFFRVMPLPVLAGDPNAAMAAPDGLVLTRQAARKYFGQDAPIGQVLMVNPGLELPPLRPDAPPAQRALFQRLTAYHPMRVMAVLEDLPSNTHLHAQVFGSGRAPFSLLSLDDANPSPFQLSELTYARLKPGASADAARARLADFALRRYPGASPKVSSFRFRLTPLADLHFSAGQGPGAWSLRDVADPRVDGGLAAEGGLIVLIAAINFVTLMTARASRRAVEVGVRKASGARQADLIIQFMGETLIYVAVAMAVAMVLVELALPPLNAFLDRTLAFDYLRDPGLVGAIVGAALLTALLAGLYPALVLSSFRPAVTLKGGSLAPAGSARAREVLVVAQFAIVIGLILVTATIYRQTQFALHDALRLNTSQNVRMQTACRSSFHQQLAALPGVKAVSCGDQAAVSAGGSNSLVTMPDRSIRTLNSGVIDIGFFEMHGLKPLAGRFPSRAHSEDVVLDKPVPGPYPDLQPTLVVNQSAARLLGYARPADAVGKTINWTRWSASSNFAALPPSRPSQIVGVVNDFTLGSIRSVIPPTIYYVDPSRGRFILAKLDGTPLPETLKAMDEAWRRTGHERVLGYAFESATVQSLYRDVITQGIAIAVCAGLAVVIACLGLFALAAFVTERRTKEIGVRKAMGADPLDVVRLLLWQFTQPVLWANLIAWPAAFWVMDYWLHGFAYRVALPPWLFLAATAAAVLIAWITVSFQSWMAARSKPALALRYE
ncbi:MAG: ABC transporter permease [Caulobacteraceae bacterium]